MSGTVRQQWLDFPRYIYIYYDSKFDTEAAVTVPVAIPWGKKESSTTPFDPHTPWLSNLLVL